MLALGISNFFVHYCAGLLAQKGVRVNYTRKIVHFAEFILPVVVNKYFVYEGGLGTLAMLYAVILASLLIFLKPIRKRSAFVATMFASFDRPEDRPNTLLWVAIQDFLGAIVGILLVWRLTQLGMLHVLIMTTAFSAIGDGLAEPVGVRWGRHRYRVLALFSKQKHHRTWEGSAVVFICTALSIVWFRYSFSPHQFLLALIAVPILVTLAEAWSPHTIDQPFIELAGALSLYAVLSL